MASKTIGYIVVGPHGPNSLGSDNVLWIGGEATLFTDRRRAERALLRTKAYVILKGYSWPWLQDSYIHPVRWVS